MFWIKVRNIKIFNLNSDISDEIEDWSKYNQITTYSFI